MAFDSYVIGELESENGCLRIRDSRTDSSRLIIWRHQDAMTADQQGVRITDEFGEVTNFYVGDKVQIGGGQGAIRPRSKFLQHPIPNNCRGPYWLSGGGVSAYTE